MVYAASWSLQETQNTHTHIQRQFIYYLPPLYVLFHSRLTPDGSSMQCSTLCIQLFVFIVLRPCIVPTCNLRRNYKSTNTISKFYVNAHNKGRPLLFGHCYPKPFKCEDSRNLCIILAWFRSIYDRIELLCSFEFVRYTLADSNICMCMNIICLYIFEQWYLSRLHLWERGRERERESECLSKFLFTHTFIGEGKEKRLT